VAVLCGVVWGLWIGFAIVAAGTFLGEVGNFYAFIYCCRSRGEKLERTKISYACLAKVVREGGFKIALIARLSAIPGHFTTAVFSTCGMGIIVFSIAATLSLPKQLITVYLGVILEQSGTGSTSTKSRIISDVVLAFTFLVTILAMWYIFSQMNGVKRAVIYDRRKARQAKIARGDFIPYTHPNATESNTVFNPDVSDSNIPLTGSLYQRWDKEGRAVGHAGDPQLYAPQPKHASRLSPGPVAVSAEQYPGDREVTGDRGRSSSRQDSIDSIGWDMQAPVSRNQVLAGQAPSPSQVPSSANYTHLPEATEDGYYSAQSDDHSRMSPTALGQRAFSPPPPSYRTNLR